MHDIELIFQDINYRFPFAFVQGTGDHAFLFGLENDQRSVHTKDFFISKYPVTQILWTHIMGDNPSVNSGDYKPVQRASYDEIMAADGFMHKMQVASREQVSHQLATENFQFTLPTETQWEYAARGGIHWGDYFMFSGGDNIDELGWYKQNSGDGPAPVGQKKCNQLGLYDMSGNVWEWCLDYFQSDTQKIPLDGSACLEKSNDRVLRGGCFHNMAIHCTVMKRYEIPPESKDPCIGFRVVIAL